MKISIDSIIDAAKFELGLRDTTYADLDLERLINQAAVGMDSLNTYVISCETLELDCQRADLPDSFTELICMQPLTDSCTGCCGIINYDPATDESPTSILCNCSSYYAVNRNVLTAFCGLGGSCGDFGASGFGIQNNQLIFPSSFTPTEVKIWYRGFNKDEDGIMVLDELMERGLAAYAAYKYARSGQNYRNYAPKQIEDWKTEWVAQKNWIKGKQSQNDHRANKVQFASIAQAILVNPFNIESKNF